MATTDVLRDCDRDKRRKESECNNLIDLDHFAIRLCLEHSTLRRLYCRHLHTQLLEQHHKQFVCHTSPVVTMSVSSIAIGSASDNGSTGGNASVAGAGGSAADKAASTFNRSVASRIANLRLFGGFFLPA